MQAQRVPCLLLLASATQLLGCAPDLLDPPLSELVDGPVPLAQVALADPNPLGGTGTRVLTGIAADSTGSIGLVGFLDGTLTLDEDTIQSSGSEDLFLADEALVHFPASDPQRGNALAFAADDRFVLAGEMSGSVTIGNPLTSAGGRDALVAVLDADGTPQWARRFGDKGYQSATSVAVDAQGNVLVAGIFSGAIDLGAGELTSAGGHDVFVASFDLAGNPRWSARLGGASEQRVAAIAPFDGGVLVVGDFQGPLEVGSTSLTSVGERDVFAVLLGGEDGKVRWARSFGNAGTQEAAGVAVDGNGHAVIVGSFSGLVDLGGLWLVTEAGQAMFIAALAATGKPFYARAFGGAGKEDRATSRGIAMKADGSAVIVADFEGLITIGEHTFQSNAEANLLFLELDASGHAQRTGSPEDGVARRAVGVALDDAGRPVMIGHAGAALDGSSPGEPFLATVVMK